MILLLPDKEIKSRFRRFLIVGKGDLFAQQAGQKWNVVKPFARINIYHNLTGGF